MKKVTRKEQVKELFLKGIPYNEIASQMGCSNKIVSNVVYQLRKEGSLPSIEEKQAARNEQVKKLFLKGMSYGEIASQMGCSSSTIKSAVCELRKEGSLPSKETKKEQVKKLFLQGMPYNEIASQMGCSKSTARSVVYQLRKEGSLPSKEERPTRRKGISKEQVKKLFLQGMRYDEIASQLECSKNSVSIIICRLRKEGSLPSKEEKPAKRPRGKGTKKEKAKELFRKGMSYREIARQIDSSLYSTIAIINRVQQDAERELQKLSKNKQLNSSEIPRISENVEFLLRAYTRKKDYDLAVNTLDRYFEFDSQLGIIPQDKKEGFEELMRNLRSKQIEQKEDYSTLVTHKGEER